VDCQGRPENREHGPVFLQDKYRNGAYAIEEELPLDDVRERVQRRELGVGGHDDSLEVARTGRRRRLITAGSQSKEQKAGAAAGAAAVPAAEFKSDIPTP
jgi:hypothetical protein